LTPLFWEAGFKRARFALGFGDRIRNDNAGAPAFQQTLRKRPTASRRALDSRGLGSFGVNRIILAGDFPGFSDLRLLQLANKTPPNLV
jgi:hypothetical protein